MTTYAGAPIHHRESVRQREAWQRGEMLYVGGSGVYHLPGQTNGDKVKSLCGTATGRIGVWNIFDHSQLGRRRLCKDCAHLATAKLGVAAPFQGLEGEAV
jgi:hypothetical protein